MEVFRSEIKVGVLILVSFVLLLVGIFITSNIRDLWDKKKSIVLLFPYADGITRGSPVWYAGLEVGEVSAVRIATDAKDRIAVTVKINPDARVRKDSRVDIRSLGMMGAKYVEITPGSPESPELPPGESLEGERPSSLTEVIETGQKVAARMVDLIQETRKVVQDLGSDTSIKATVQNANAFLVDMRENAKELKPVLKKLSAFGDTLNAAGQNVKTLTGDGGKELTALVKELRRTNQDLQAKLGSVESQLTKALGQVDKGFAEAGGFAKDARALLASNEQDVASLLKHLNETSRHLEALSEDLRAHPYKFVWKKEGTLDQENPAGTERWREKGRIGPYGKE